MSKKSKNEKGFTAVEGLLIILILVLIGVVGYMVYNNGHKSKAASVSSKVSTPNPYAGWKTYTASLEPISFKYPANWNINQGPDFGPSKSSNEEYVRLNGPIRTIDGTSYKFYFTLNINTPQGNPNYSSSEVQIASSNKLTDPSYPKPLYALILNLDEQEDEVVASTANYQVGTSNMRDFVPFPTSTAGRAINMGGFYQNINQNTLLNNLSLAQFASLPEVQQAEKVFSSLAQN
jgi:hypothetical protein